MRYTAHRQYWVGLMLLASIAAATRLWEIGGRPGYEWDETVYYDITNRLAEGGPLQAKTEYNATPETYLYHPPFYFVLLRGWFSLTGSGIADARVFSAVCSVAAIVLCSLLLRRTMGAWSLAAGLTLGIDGWLLYTGRISWIENSMMLLVLAAIWLYISALETGRTMQFVTTGVVMGVATCYKHVGLYVAGALLYWVVRRDQHRNHMLLVTATVSTLAAYALGMWAFFGQDYEQATMVQIRRSLGLRESRGTVTNVGDAVHALTTQYSIFWPTVLTTILALILVLAGAVRAVRDPARVSTQRGVLLAWTVGTLAFFAVLQLKMPHYLLMLLVPLYMTAATELHATWPGYCRHAPYRYALLGLAGMLVTGNMLVFGMRIVAQTDNATVALSQWVAANVPHDAQVITEESLGTAIPQPYCKMGHASKCLTDSDYIITYTSVTQRVPDTPGLRALIDTATPLAVFRGFKEELTVYRINR